MKKNMTFVALTILSLIVFFDSKSSAEDRTTKSHEIKIESIDLTRDINISNLSGDYSSGTIVIYNTKIPGAVKIKRTIMTEDIRKKMGSKVNIGSVNIKKSEIGVNKIDNPVNATGIHSKIIKK